MYVECHLLLVHKPVHMVDRLLHTCILQLAPNSLQVAHISKGPVLLSQSNIPAFAQVVGPHLALTSPSKSAPSVSDNVQPLSSDHRTRPSEDAAAAHKHGPGVELSCRGAAPAGAGGGEAAAAAVGRGPAAGAAQKQPDEAADIEQTVGVGHSAERAAGGQLGSGKGGSSLPVTEDAKPVISLAGGQMGAGGGDEQSSKCSVIFKEVVKGVWRSKQGKVLEATGSSSYLRRFLLPKKFMTAELPDLTSGAKLNLEVKVPQWAVQQAKAALETGGMGCLKPAGLKEEGATEVCCEGLQAGTLEQSPAPELGVKGAGVWAQDKLPMASTVAAPSDLLRPLSTGKGVPAPDVNSADGSVVVCALNVTIACRGGQGRKPARGVVTFGVGVVRDVKTCHNVELKLERRLDGFAGWNYYMIELVKPQVRASSLSMLCHSEMPSCVMSLAIACGFCTPKQSEFGVKTGVKFLAALLGRLFT